MSAFKGTPGPWQVGEDGDVIWGPEWKGRKTFVASVPFNKTPRTKADARLIASAPDGLTAGTDLLDVVKSAIRAGDWKVDGACDPDAAIRRMEQFIAKATGEQS